MTCASTGPSAPAPPPCARTTPITPVGASATSATTRSATTWSPAPRVGLQAGFHCIGDDGVSAAVQGLRRAAEVVGASALRSAGHRLEHVEMLDPGDIASLADLSVTASVQPAFDAAWGTPGELYEQRLGPERSRLMNPVWLAAARRCAAGLRHRRPGHAGGRLGDGRRRGPPLPGRGADEPGGRVCRGHPRRARRGGESAGGGPCRRSAGGRGHLGLHRRRVRPDGLPRLEPGHEPRCLALAVGTQLIIVDEALQDALPGPRAGSAE